MAERDHTQKRKRRLWYLWMASAIALAAVMLYGYYIFPHEGLGPKQPIPFSHRIHAGVKNIDCRFCHPFPEESKHAGLPSEEKCFFCHQYVIPLHPEIAKERTYFEAKIPVRWTQVFFTPDFVKFRHEPHVGWAQIDCTECHGQVKEMDRLQYVGFQMGFCIGCHRQRGAQTDCWLACHH